MDSPVATPTRSIQILSNEVSYGGNVFPSGVAIISHRAVNVVIANNSAHHHRYSGVSIGWKWGYGTSFISNILVQGNYIYNIEEHILYDANNTIVNNVFARTSVNPPPIPDVDDPDSDVRIQLAEDHTSWTFTRNIIYDTYQGIDHSAFKSDVGVTA